jgi:hypothetical protein
LKDALAAKDAAMVKTRVDELKNVLGEISAQVYRAAGPHGAQTGQPGGSGTGQGFEQGKQGQ